MLITDTKAKTIPPPPTNGCNIKIGTVFVGRIHDVSGPWLRTIFGAINLRDTIIHNYSNFDVFDYEPREAELILR